jgi:hypothetical protein
LEARGVQVDLFTSACAHQAVIIVMRQHEVGFFFIKDEKKIAARTRRKCGAMRRKCGACGPHFKFYRNYTQNWREVHESGECMKLPETLRECRLVCLRRSHSHPC